MPAHKLIIQYQYNSYFHASRNINVFLPDALVGLIHLCEYTIISIWLQFSYVIAFQIDGFVYLEILLFPTCIHMQRSTHFFAFFPHNV